VCERVWKNIVEPGMPHMTIVLMRIPRWIPKATKTQPEYVMLIAFPLWQWLQEGASVLCYPYIACLVSSLFARLYAAR